MDATIIIATFAFPAAFIAFIIVLVYLENVKIDYSGAKRISSAEAAEVSEAWKRSSGPLKGLNWLPDYKMPVGSVVIYRNGAGPRCGLIKRSLN